MSAAEVLAETLVRVYHSLPCHVFDLLGGYESELVSDIVAVLESDPKTERHWLVESYYEYFL